MPETIASILDHTRDLTKWYLSKIDPERITQQIRVNGERLNSVYWIAAHLVWAEHSLVLAGMGAPAPEISWLKTFSIQSPQADGHQPEWPSYDEVIRSMDEVHQASLAHIRSLSDRELDEPYPDENFRNIFKTKRRALYHTIRHEGTHAGQLSWCCKLLGVKTI